MNKIHPAVFLLSFLFLPGHLLCQTNNLVPNPGFEQYKALPDAAGQGVQCIATWRIPVTTGQGDYYNANVQNNKANTLKNEFGGQPPHSGSAYAGICITKKFREYLQVDLLQPLEKGRQYKIQVFISCADKIGLSTVDEFGVLFSKKMLIIPAGEYLSAAPHVTFRDENKYGNKNDWTALSSVYTADGTERLMTFGSFLYTEHGKNYGEISGKLQYAHYYVDDISIMPVPDAVVKTDPVVKNEKKDTVPVTNFVAGKTYVFNNIQFETAESKLLPKAFPELDNLVEYLLKNPKQKLVITGHTDNVGNPEDNLKLSYQRAKTIMLYLVSHNISESLISIEGKGDKSPVESNDTESGREKNRRVEISFL